jgi:flagellar basal body-associated protein FliL
MWQDKKFLVIISLVVVLIAAVGTIGGIFLARQNNVAQISEARDDAFRRVTIIFPENRSGTNWQEALDNYLQHLIDNGTITQEEANQFNTWWESRPDIPGLFNRSITPEGFMFFR